MKDLAKGRIFIQSRSPLEDSLLVELAPSYRIPDFLQTASQCRVLSFGGGVRGVQMMQHGVAWLGLVAGAKLWHVADPRLPKPSDRHCAKGFEIDYPLAAEEGVAHHIGPHRIARPA